VGVALAAAVLPAAALAASLHATQSPAAQAQAVKVSVSGHHVTVTGSVKLTPDTAVRRGETAVAIKLTGAGGYDRDVLPLSRTGTFKRDFDTALSGQITVAVTALTGVEHYLGTTVKQTVTVAPAAAATVTTTTPAPSAAAITTTTAPSGAVPLVGTFTIGSGSYFQMLNGDVVVPNPSAGGAGLTTPLSAGSDGGLETFGYQPAPSPAFAGGTSGGALASRIIVPIPFEGINFSVQTSATDAQTATADAVPSIDTNAAGVLSGQVTAWDAQYNGLSFNQGTPKPGGATPGSTTALSGTYTFSSGAYTLNWKSLIVGGPFNGFTGSWHLQGTFKPAVFS
jgi:hypothetical protein